MPLAACPWYAVADASRAPVAGRPACVSARTLTIQGTDARMLGRLAIRYAREPVSNLRTTRTVEHLPAAVPPPLAPMLFRIV